MTNPNTLLVGPIQPMTDQFLGGKLNGHSLSSSPVPLPSYRPLIPRPPSPYPRRPGPPRHHNLFRLLLNMDPPYRTHHSILNSPTCRSPSESSSHLSLSAVPPPLLPSPARLPRARVGRPDPGPPDALRPVRDRCLCRPPPHQEPRKAGRQQRSQAGQAGGGGAGGGGATSWGRGEVEGGVGRG